VAAAVALAKLNSAGPCVEDTVNMSEVFDRMTDAELEVYVEDGTLPKRFTETEEMS